MVGDEVEQGGVDVVTDGADHGGECRRDGPNHGLVAEGQQVLDPATATGDDDDVDLGVGVELGERRAHLRHGIRALNRDLADLEHRGRPAPAGVLDDVALGRARPAADQPDAPGKER